MLFLLAAPGVVAGIIPWWITGWRGVDWGGAGWLVIPVAALIIAAGIGFLLHAFARFAMQGVGAPAPVAPTRHLVVTGVYRWVRNPMYLAVVSIVLGQALLLGSWALAAYAGVLIPVFWSFVRFYEEPTLRDRFGNEYDDYLARVPGWVPKRPVATKGVRE